MDHRRTTVKSNHRGCEQRHDARGVMRLLCGALSSLPPHHRHYYHSSLVSSTRRSRRRSRASLSVQETGRETGKRERGREKKEEKVLRAGPLSAVNCVCACSVKLANLLTDIWSTHVRKIAKPFGSSRSPLHCGRAAQDHQPRIGSNRTEMNTCRDTRGQEAGSTPYSLYFSVQGVRVSSCVNWGLPPCE